MAMDLERSLAESGSILGICPCCGEVFRLSDAHLFVKGKKPGSEFDKIDRAFVSLARAEEKLDDMEDELREAAREKGRRQAKRKLKKIDPVFSGQGIDPQDVKVIFHPVEYVVFEGLNKDRFRQISLMAHRPTSREHERVQDSVKKAVRKGNVEFYTLKVAADGGIEAERSR